MLASMLFTHQVFSAYAFKFLQTRPNEWSSVQTLVKYNFTNAEWNQFEQFAENQLKMKDLALLLRQEKQSLIPYIKEEFSRQLWQESNQMRFLLGKDQEMKRALQR
jgi:AAA+ superfamily predicted ATPase